MRKFLLILSILIIYFVINGVNTVDRILDYNFTSEKQSETNQDKESYTWTDDVLPRTPTNQTTQPDEDDIINKYETSYEELNKKP